MENNTERKQVYANKTPRPVNRKPDADGMFRVTILLRLTPELREFLERQAEKERRSLSTMALMQLEAYKEKIERLGL